MAITDQLRNEIIDSGKTHYRIWKDSGIGIKSLDCFVSQARPYLRSDTMDKLCDYFDLELRKKSGASAKKKRTTAKRATKKKR